MSRVRAPRRVFLPLLLAAGAIAGAIAGALLAPGGGTGGHKAARAAAEPLWQPVREGLFGDIVAEIALTGRPPGSVRSMLLMPEGRGLYRLSDDAATWEAVLPDPDRATAMVQALVVARDDLLGRTVYAGLQGRTRFARSEDAGRTWVARPGPAFLNRVDRLETSVESGRVFAAQSDRPTLHTSMDRGESWVEHPLPGGDASLKALFAAPDDPVVYLVRGDVLYRSDDDPSQWSVALRPDPSPPVTVSLAIDLAAAGPRGRLHAAGRTAGGAYLVRSSEDRGRAWVGAGWPEDAEGVRPTALAGGEVRPGLNGIWLALDDGRVFVSEDRGLTWQHLASLPIRGTRIAVDPYTGEVWVGTDGLGLYRVDPEPRVHTGAVSVEVLGLHATLRPTDTETIGILLAEVLPERRDLTGVTPPLFGLFRSEGGLVWSLDYLTVELGAELVASPAFDADQTLYAGRKRSTDGGRTFVDLPAGPSGRSPHVLSVGPITGTRPIVFGIEEPYEGGVGGEGLVLSEDGGDTWAAVDTVPIGVVDAVASPGFKDDRTAFAVSAGGFVYGSGDGLTFRLVGRIPSYDPIERNVYDLAVSPAFPQDGTLLAAVEDKLATPRAHVYVSTNRGASWQSRTEGLDASARPRILSLSPQFAVDRVVFLGTERTEVDPPLPGVFASDSGGADWFAEAFFLPSRVRAFAWAGLPGQGRLFGAAGLAGLWVRDLGEPIGGLQPTPSAGPTAGSGTPTPTGTTATVSPSTTTPAATPSPTTIVTGTATGGTVTPTGTATAAPTVRTGTATPTAVTPSPSATATATSTSTWTPSPSASPSDVPTGRATDDGVRRVAYLPTLIRHR